MNLGLLLKLNIEKLTIQKKGRLLRTAFFVLATKLQAAERLNFQIRVGFLQVLPDSF